MIALGSAVLRQVLARSGLIALVLLVSTLVIACGGVGGVQQVKLPPPTERSEMGPGDVFTL